MNFHAKPDEIVAHWLHLLALKGEDTCVAKGYARRDARLRKSVGMPALASADFKPPYEDVAALLSATPTEAPAQDREWFQKRWELGEKEAMDLEACAMVKALDELPQTHLLSTEPFYLLCSPALAQSAHAHHPPNKVLCGPETSALWVALQSFAALLGPDLPLEGLSKADRSWVAAHVTVGAWQIALGEEAALPVWAEVLTPYLLPSLERGEQTANKVHQIAEHVLDEPPGETFRIADGLAARMPSRLIRAWRRGYFVPKGFDLEGWLSQKTSIPSGEKAKP